MRRTIVIGLLVSLIGGGVAYAATGSSKPRTSSLARSVQRTMNVRAQRYALDMQILRNNTPHIIHSHAAVAPGTVSVDLRLGDVKLGKLVIPGQESRALIEGPFLYERAPSGVVVLGKIHWLRESLASLGKHAQALQSVTSLTADPLLRILSRTHARANSDASVYTGTVAYDDPVVADALTPLTAGLQFRNLRVTVWIGPGGLVRRVKLTGQTADHHTTLLMKARLFGFGRPVHVTPPREGTFMDQGLVPLTL